MELVSDEIIDKALGSIGWTRQSEELVKVVRRHDFREAMAYVNLVAKLAETIGHHPDIEISWNTVTLRLSTHSLGGLTDADLDLARRIDALGQ